MTHAENVRVQEEFNYLPQIESILIGMYKGSEDESFLMARDATRYNDDIIDFDEMISLLAEDIEEYLVCQDMEVSEMSTWAKEEWSYWMTRYEMYEHENCSCGDRGCVKCLL